MAYSGPNLKRNSNTNYRFGIFFQYLTAETKHQ